MKNDLATQRDEALQKLGKLIQDIKIGMLTTIDADGHLRSRPMALQQTEFNGDLWFFTGLNSPKSEELGHDSRVNVSLAKPSDQEYVSISGRATVVRDPAKAKELWSPIFKAWFPKGLEDPNLGLIKVEVEQAEFWDAPSSAMVQLFGFVKAALTGQSSKGEGTDHQKVALKTH